MKREKQIRFERRTVAPPMRFQERDSQLLRAVFSYDGVLARRQIKTIFWPQASPQAMERRLTLLYHSSYLTIPNSEQRRTYPISEPIVWLGWRGIVQIATDLGVDVQTPAIPNENQLRTLDRHLRQAGVHWQREPRWSQISHDIAVNDFRLAIEQAAKHWPSISLEEWIPESIFSTNMDKVTISMNGQKKLKGVRPDGFFVLLDHLRQINNSPARARFLLELDNSTHPLPRFGRDKAIAGLAYLRSKAYKLRFGFNSGRWLIVCRGEERLKHLKAQTENSLGKDASVFLFATLSTVGSDSVLTEPIWFRGGSNDRVALVNNIGADH